jgi:hypothetical protein
VISKNLFLKNPRARRAHIYMKALLYNVDSSFFKSWSLGVRRGHSREKKIFFSRTRRPISIKLGTYHPQVKGILNFQIKGQVLLKGEIITKIGGVI